MIILGIETSCDETAASVASFDNGVVKILSNVVSSQINIHKKYGGVVPEIAAREHMENIIPVIDKALAKAGIDKKELAGGKKNKPLDAIAIATGPGLITSLLVGVETAKTLSFAWDVPLVSVNHIEGHIYANFISETQISKSKFPTVILTVSGGHTMIVLMDGHGKFKMIGETRDDAAGEAFDKAAKLLGIGYPGGPAIAEEAEKWNGKGKITLPRPMINDKSLDLSFSGLKTALLYQIQNDKNWKKRIPAYAHEFQAAVIDVLVSKTIKAAKKYNVNNIMLAGGVASNIKLREELARAVSEKLNKVNLHIPDLRYTTDNAAMVAAAGCFKTKAKKFTSWRKAKADSNQEL